MKEIDKYIKIKELEMIDKEMKFQQEIYGLERDIRIAQNTQKQINLEFK